MEPIATLWLTPNVSSKKTSMKPYSKCLADYYKGDIAASFSIVRDDGFKEQVPASVFFTGKEFSSLETRGLDLCKGHVLDVGAGAGRHSLELIRRGFPVTALDISPEMETILRDRGIREVIISDIFSFSDHRFDTLLMLMKGIGMVGTVDRLDQFLKHAHQLTAEAGQILCDSIDVSKTSDPVHVAYRQRNLELGKPAGQQNLVMTYKTESEPFEWLHIDFPTLEAHCQKTGWVAGLILEEPNGHYLCTMTKK